MYIQCMENISSTTSNLELAELLPEVQFDIIYQKLQSVTICKVISLFGTYVNTLNILFTLSFEDMNNIIYKISQYSPQEMNEIYNTLAPIIQIDKNILFRLKHCILCIQNLFKDIKIINDLDEKWVVLVNNKTEAETHLNQWLIDLDQWKNRRNNHITELNHYSLHTPTIINKSSIKLFDNYIENLQIDIETAKSTLISISKSQVQYIRVLNKILLNINCKNQ